MAARKLSTAILGLDSVGQLLAKAALCTDSFEVKAVADKDSVIAENGAKQYGCAAFDDYRQLMIQSQLDCLLVAEDIHRCEEHIRAAMKKRFHVLKMAPPARQFEEALELCRLAEGEAVQFVVANPLRFRASVKAAEAVLQSGEVESPFLVSAVWQAGRENLPAWCADPKLAGGGVLLHDGYGLIDQILSSFPMPEQVYCVTTNQAPDRKQRLCLTEDTAIVCLRFSDSLVGNVVVSRQGGSLPPQQWVRVYGKEAALTVEAGRLLIDRGGQHEVRPCDDNPLDCMVKQLQDFALAVESPREHCAAGSNSRSLGTMAVIEAAYLSARTGCPEEPSRFLRMAGGRAGAAATA